MKKTVLILLLFTSLLLFSFTSLALIPGDFNEDGKVDFDDLMIFALAYGSTPTSSNWDARCDLEQDNQIDFEDLMLFAMNYGTKGPVCNTTQKLYYNTIQSALDAANSGDIIEVKEGTYDESIVFPSNKKIVLKSISGPSSTIIMGKKDLNTISFDNPLQGTTLEGFTVTHHPDDNIGRGIYNDGNLTIHNCIVSGNVAASRYSVICSGGGIQNLGTLTISDAIISDNIYCNMGGGIQNLGTLTISDSTISNNNYNYVVGYPSPSGGGIYNGENAILTILRSNISNNSCGYSGGGIYCFGGEVTIDKCTITGNNGNRGGGILIFSPSKVTITESTILNNTAMYGAGICNWGNNTTIDSCTISDNYVDWGKGGGVYNSGSLVISNSTISGNSIDAFITDYGGGGIYNCGDLYLSHSRITENYSPEHGGGLYNEDLYGVGTGKIFITGCEILYNSSKKTMNRTGGIYHFGTLLSIIDSDISYNDGGGIYFLCPYFCDYSMIIKGSIISNNSNSGIYIRHDNYNQGLPDNIIIIGGNDSNENNTICGNYEIEDVYNLENQIRDIEGSLYEFFKETNYISTNCAEAPNERTCRALLVGVGEYVHYEPEPGENTLTASYDVNMMYDTLNHSADEFERIDTLMDLQATKSAILSGIASTFTGATDDDISYFYFDGHGARVGGTSYLAPTDAFTLDTFINVDELESALNAIPGTKVVFIGACHSGGFIGKGSNENGITFNPEEFNRNVIDAFVSRDLTGNKYQVLTSCHSDQRSLSMPGDPSISDDPFGLFTMALCTGIGYFSNYPADTNRDNKVSLHEAYIFTRDWINDYIKDWPLIPPDNIIAVQDVQVYPEHSTFTIIKY